jgi:release factor glutamine methyltransferase
MEVSSNKIKDIKSHYFSLLQKNFSKEEAEYLINLLLIEYSDYSKHEIFLYPEKPLSESELLKVHFAVKDLLKDKPIQYILGEVDFINVKLKVNESVLIPRPETEELVEIICRDHKDIKEKVLKILDIGTGSGAIAIALKKYFRNAEVTALDISKEALMLARRNAEINNTEVTFLKKDILKEGIEEVGKYDLIVSNPPYVRELEKNEMKKNVLDYEPALALFVPNHSALIFYRRIAELSNGILKNKGSIYLEINQYLAEETKALFTSNGEVELTRDFRNNDRFLIVRNSSFA